MSRLRRLTATVSIILIATGMVVGCGKAGTTVPTTPSVDDAQAMDALYQCLLDKGVPATRGDDGSVGWKGVEGIDAEKAQSDCMVELEEFFPVPSRAELERWYDELDALHTCLVNAGFPPTDGWPTKEVFVENDGQYSVLLPDDASAAHDACPEEYEVANS